MAGNQRIEALKIYLAILLAEGEFAGASSMGDRLARAGATLVEDLPTALREMVELAGDSVPNRAASAVLGVVKDLVGKVRQKGVGAVWRDVQEQYKRGMEVKARRAK